MSDFTSQPTEKDTEEEETKRTKSASDTASLDSYVDMSSVTIRKESTVLDDNYSLVGAEPASDTDEYVDVNSVSIQKGNRESAILQPESDYSLVDAENFGRPASSTSTPANNPLYGSVANSEGAAEEEAMYVNVVR